MHLLSSVMFLTCLSKRYKAFLRQYGRRFNSCHLAGVFLVCIRLTCHLFRRRLFWILKCFTAPRGTDMTSLIPHLIDFFSTLIGWIPLFYCSNSQSKLKMDAAREKKNVVWSQRGKKIAKLACVARIYHAVFTLVTCVLPSWEAIVSNGFLF